MGIAADRILSECSEAWVVELGANLDSRAADWISNFKNLQALKVGLVVEPERAIQTLKSMHRLKYLHGSFDSDLLEQLQASLPTCEVSTTVSQTTPSEKTE